MTVDWRNPHSGEAETDVLSHLFHWPLERSKILEQVGPQDFYVPRHRAAFEALAVQNYSHTALAAQVGCTREQVVEMVGSTVFSGSVASSVRLLCGLTMRRQLLAAVEHLGRLARDPSVADDAVLADVRAQTARVELPTLAVEPAMDVEAFLQGPEEYDWLVPDLMERGDRIVVTARGGVGKSTLLRQLAVCIAAGLHPFRFTLMEPRKVLAIDLENGERKVRRSLRSMVGQARRQVDDFNPENFRVKVKPDGLNVLDRAGELWLAQQIAATTPDLVVLGPLYKSYRGDMNDEQVATGFQVVIDRLRERFGISVLIEAHPSKASVDLAPFGSSAWERWSELGVGLKLNDAKTEAECGWWRLPREGEAVQWPPRFRRGGAWPYMPIWEEPLAGAA